MPSPQDPDRRKEPEGRERIVKNDPHVNPEIGSRWLTIEEWLLARNFDQALANHEQGKRLRRLITVLAFAVVVLVICVVALSIQLQLRNERLDRLDSNTQKIVTIAEEFERRFPENG